MSVPARDHTPDAAAVCRHGLVTDLLLRCGRGDGAALAQLFDLFYPPVRATVAARVPPARVDAVTAQVFVQVWRQASRFRPDAGGAVGWIMRVAATAPDPLAGPRIDLDSSGVGREVRPPVRIDGRRRFRASVPGNPRSL